MADLDLILGNRGPFTPQSPADLTLTLGPPPGSPEAPHAATIGATVRFSGAVAAAVPQLATLVATVRFSGAVAAVAVQPVVISATVRFAGAIGATFDLGLPVYVSNATGAQWQAADPLRASSGAVWRDGERMQSIDEMPWRDGDRMQTTDGLPWRDGAWVSSDAGNLPWRDGAAAAASHGMPWRDGERVAPQPTRLPWRLAERAGSTTLVPWRDGARLRASRAVAWRQGATSAVRKGLPWRAGARSLNLRRLPWRDGHMVHTHGNNPFVTTPVTPPFHPPVDLRFCAIWTPKDPQALQLVLGIDPCAGTGPPAVVVVPIRRVYFVLNTVSLTRVAGAVPIACFSLELSLDVDSWTWGFSASLPASELPNVEPVSGAPAELEASINGVSYRVLAERLARERTFGQSGIRVSGRGTNAVLDVLPGTYENAGAVRTAAQLMDDALAVNGVGVGWGVDFGLDDWLVPAGVWSYQGTAIAAVNAIAAAAGGYVQPHATADTLRVLPRYPTAPWDWAGLTPDYELPSAVTVREAIEWVDRPGYNRVFVSGTKAGILAQVTRAGSAGDIVAPMVTDALITQAAAGRQRGLAVLGNTGRQASVSLRLPVLATTGLILPGKFIRYVDGLTTRVGLVRSMAAEVAWGEVWQTIGVETHE